MSENFDVKKHMFVPEHIKLSPAEKKEVLEKYGVSFKHLPKILTSDPGIAHLNAKQGDVIKITRIEFDGENSVFYRGVENE
ncbi:MAG: DNA-directed RNA polymerase subunit RpoH/Rpb5 C-terminal domain-containing protein [Candidatus Woesearchaeota archaeon]